jgi:hypothetical protein
VNPNVGISIFFEVLMFQKGSWHLLAYIRVVRTTH